MSDKTPITVAYGDGIGPEIMEAVFRVLDAAGARLAPEVIEIGEKVYLEGHTSGIRPQDWESLRRTKVFLKSPITTPSGGGFKSLNVTIRKTLGLYANVRPCVSYAPFVPTRHPKMDIVIIRENEEDLYAGIEHRQTDGLFRRVFDEVAQEYPEIETDHAIIDIGAARLATRPERFDVVVTLNLYGDILSDIAAEMTGSVGLAGSANIGEQVAMFEAIHGSAPDIAGKGIANPSGLLLAAVMMLVHVRQAEVAQRVHNAWLRTIEDGVYTAELRHAQIGRPFGSMDFADAVVQRLGFGHWRCRFVGVDEAGAPREVTHADIVALLHNLESDRLDFIKTENLCTFDGEAGYALGQGQ